MPVNEQITDSVTQVDTKVLGEMPAQSMGMLVQGMVADQLRANQNATVQQQQGWALSQAGLVMGINKLLNLDPAEAISMLKTMTGNDLGQQLAGVIAGLGAGQEATKSAQTTPPVTTPEPENQ